MPAPAESGAAAGSKVVLPLAFFFGAVGCLALGYVAGRWIPGLKGPDNDDDDKFFRTPLEKLCDTYYSIPHSRYTDVQQAHDPAIDSLPIFLKNVSRTGNGWAPWQLTMEGPSDYQDPHQSWVNMNGVMAIVIDPDAVRSQPRNHIDTRFRVTVKNNLDDPSIIHWHGFVPPNNLDGIPWISSMPIQPNRSQYFDFTIYHRGFMWAHSHFGDQLEAGLFMPIIIKDHPTVRKELGNPTEVLMTLFNGHWRTECAYQYALHPHECPIGKFDNWDEYQFNVNGHNLQQGGAQEVLVPAGGVVRLRILHAGATSMFRVTLGNLTGEILATDGMLVKRDHFTSDFPVGMAERWDLLIPIPAEGGRWDILATRCGTGSTADNNMQRSGLVLKTAGAESRALPPGIAPGPTAPFDKVAWNTTVGPLEALNGLLDPLQAPDVHHTITLTGEFDQSEGLWRPAFSINGKEVHVWPAAVWCKAAPGQTGWDMDDTVLNQVFCQGNSIRTNIYCKEYACAPGQTGGDADGRCFPASVTQNKWAGVPVSECSQWVVEPQTFRYNPDALEVCTGDRVWITFASKTPGEGHPMHLHGTHQQLIKVNGEDHVGPLKDTWFVPGGMNMTVAFDAYNPGEWLLHCHIGHHVNEGMATTLRYVSNLHPRCTRRYTSWAATPGLPVSEWPPSWDKLWNKQDPTTDQSAVFPQV
jgi:FtsP/CotA-like multicopper oxidase with cupredoxin domain